MDMGSRIRWIIIIIIMLTFVIFVAWGLYSIARNIFNRTTSSSGSETVQVEDPIDLTTAGVARFEVEGPVVANEEQRSYVITITSAEAKIQLYERYGAKVISQKSYPNTQDSFDAFMAALDHEDIQALEKGSTEDLAYQDEGVCASGRRYILEIDSDIRRWTTSCSSKEGNAGFNMNAVRSLFQKQIPDYRDVVRGTGL